METSVEQRGSIPPMPELKPLGKLGMLIRRNQYEPSAREAEVLAKCFGDAKWYYLNGALLTGAVAWTITGMARNLKLLPRIFMTGAAAMIGRDFGGSLATSSCMKKILSLEGSPLRAELISILQQDYPPGHPSLKTNLGQFQRPESMSASDPGDYAQEAHSPVSSQELGPEMDNPSTKRRDWSEVLRRGDEGGQQRNRIPRIWEIKERTEAVRQDFDGANILADPFDLFMQTGVVDDYNDSGGKQEHQIERRRSRMSIKERQEHDRRQYERRQEQHSF